MKTTHWQRTHLLAFLVIAVGVLNVSAAANAPDGRYLTDPDAGTVTDTQTGLVWQRDASADTGTWAQAQATCLALAYRLPTIKELQTLVDYSATTSPVLDPSAFPDMPTTTFWSATTFAVSTDSAWMLDFATGIPYSPPKTQMYSVRCVR